MNAIKVVVLILIFIGLSCKKQENPCPTFWGYKLPYTFYFEIKQSGGRLPDSIIDKLKLSFTQNGTNQYVSDFSRAINGGSVNAYDLGIMATREIGFRSGDDKIKDYYLEFPNGDIDTLYVDYKRLTACEADTSSCGCLYPRYIVKYNNIIANYDPSISTLGVYLFNKR